MRVGLLLLVCCLILYLPAKADVVFPARLEIKEVEPGLFEVFFVLPVIQGKVLNAQPVLPSACTKMSEPQVTGDVNMKISRWRVSCLPDSLYGEKFGIEGLLGSQVDILFSLEMLNGRSYQKMLSPVNAFFMVPETPGLFDMIGDALLNGLRSVLQHGALYLLIFMLSIAATNATIKILPMLVLAVAGYAVGQQLTAIQWLLVPQNLPEFAALLATLILSLRFIYRSDEDFSFLYWWLPPLLAMAYGCVDYLPDSLGGYNPEERIISNLFSYVGAGLSILIIYWISINFIFVINYLIKTKDRIYELLAYASGIISFGLLCYQLTPYLFSLGSRWTIPLLPVVYILVASIWYFHSGLYQRLNLTAFAGLLLAFMFTGVMLSQVGIKLDWAVSSVLLMLLVMAIYQGFMAVPSRWFSLLITAGAALMCGYCMSQLAGESLSYATAQTIGFILILGLMFILGQPIFHKLSTEIDRNKPMRMIIVVAGVALIGVVWFREFSQTYLAQIISDYAAGILRVPLVSLLLLLLAVWFWPRYRSIHKSIGLERRAPIGSMLLLATALFLLPWFTLKAKNPFSGTGEPDLDRAEVIVQQLLDNTYHAFNLQDEDQLYEQLVQSIDQELIEDIYLDSRRKLNSGVREGAEVQVKEVALLEIDHAAPNGDDGLMHFDTKWMVIARVKHLQHIHHRRNLYTGSLALKMEDAQWKISRINLLSEDRTVIPNTGG